MKKPIVYFYALFFFLLPLSAEEENHEFQGKHFLASYSCCDSEALCNEEMLKEVMLAAIEKCGAIILGNSSYVFPGHGLTMVVLLSESHASIHTYPEHGSCFVDLFTCGDKCDHTIFEKALQSYLKAQTVNQRVLIRHNGIEDQQVSKAGDL